MNRVFPSIFGFFIFRFLIVSHSDHRRVIRSTSPVASWVWWDPWWEEMSPKAAEEPLRGQRRLQCLSYRLRPDSQPCASCPILSRLSGQRERCALRKPQFKHCFTSAMLISQHINFTTSLHQSSSHSPGQPGGPLHIRSLAYRTKPRNSFTT